MERVCADTGIRSCTMTRRTLPILAALLLCQAMAGQSLAISGFREDGHAPQGGVPLDEDGRPCALLRLKTRETGLTFDAGLAGIEDIEWGDGEVLLWLPSSAKAITVAKPGSEPLRGWTIPGRLSPGGAYTARLEVRWPEFRIAEPKAYTSAIRESGGRVRLDVDTSDASTHFIDAVVGFPCDGQSDEWWGGLRYTCLPDAFGFYGAVTGSAYGEGAFFAGGAWRFLCRGTEPLDWHLFGGIGLTGGRKPALEAGVRVAFKTGRRFSGLDIGLGVQVWDGYAVPTVEVGLYIWGVPVLCALSLVVAAADAASQY